MCYLSEQTDQDSDNTVGINDQQRKPSRIDFFYRQHFIFEFAGNRQNVFTQFTLSNNVRQGSLVVSFNPGTTSFIISQKSLITQNWSWNREKRNMLRTLFRTWKFSVQSLSCHGAGCAFFYWRLFRNVGSLLIAWTCLREVADSLINWAFQNLDGTSLFSVGRSLLPVKLDINANKERLNALIGSSGNLF